MPSIFLTAYNDPAYVLVELDWTDQPQVEYVTVWRTNTATGERVQLRPYISYDANGNIALSCGTAIFWDTEPPLNVELEYCTEASDVATALNANTDFETSLAPWIQISGTAARVNTFAHTGTWSAEFTPNGTSDSGGIRDQTDYPVAAGDITAKVWVYSPQGWNGVIMRVVVQGADLLNITHDSPSFTLAAGAWQPIEFVIPNSTAATVIETDVYALGRPPASVLFYIDDVSIRQPAAVGLSVCETVTVDSDSVWLKNPLSPCLDIEVGLCSPAMDFDCEEDSRVSYAGMGDDERDANTELGQPANRIHPIPTSRQRRAPVSSLRLIAHDCAARDTVDAANAPGTPLLFQAPADYCIPDRYISVARTTEARISVDQREDFRLMVLPYATVERPAGPADGICGSRIEDLCDIYTSWTSLTSAGFDWEDLILGYGSNDGPVNPLPPGARTWDDVAVEFADWDEVEGGGSRDWDELRDGL